MTKFLTSRRLLMASIVATPSAVVMVPNARACAVDAISAAPDGVGDSGIGTGPVGPAVPRGTSVGIGVLSVGAGMTVASGDQLAPFTGPGAGVVVEPVSPLMVSLTAAMFG
jgi:hypothetical protein